MNDQTYSSGHLSRAEIAAYLGVGLVSAAALVFELALTRVFAVVQFYHFAFMAISLALLGSGVSGSLLTAWRRRIHPALLSAGFALTILGSYLLVNYVEFDPYAIAWDAGEVPHLVVNFLAAVAPFTLSGLVVGQLLESEAGRAHRIYAANLAGSAVGCVVVLPALAAFGGEGTVLLAVLLGLAAAGVFALSRSAPSLEEWSLFSLCVVFVAVGVVYPPDFMALRLSKYKGLVSALRAPDAEHTFSAWNAVARVDVVESASIHSLLGLSMNARLDPPVQAGVTLDGDNLMPITALAPDDPQAVELAKWLPLALPFDLRPEAKALVVEPGGGFDVLMALAAGASQVTAAENNALLIDAAGALYADPRAVVVNEDGRAFARRSGGQFDIVDVALTDGFKPVTSGAYSLSENYRYTVEAFADYLQALKDDGLLFVMRWLQTPPSEDARTLALILRALERLGVADPGAHIAAYRSTQLVAFVVGRQPLAEREVAQIRAFAESRRFDLVLLPGIRADEVNRFAVFPEPVYYNLYTDILARGAAVWDGYEYDISPTTDDRPFFYHFFRWGQTQEVLETLGKTWQPFGGSGYLVLLLLLALVGAASVVLIFGPLLAGRRRLSGAASAGRWMKARALLYFSLLGLAFLFVEMPLAQRFIVFVGHPITALALVLFGVLLFSGLGSLSAPRWSLPAALGVLAALVAVYPLLLPAVFDMAFNLPLWARVMVSLAVIAPPGVLMGVPFARGLAMVEALAPGLTPWVWAINGCASVVSAILAVMLAISWGFSAVLWLGAACYAGALAAMWKITA
ncbi:MAG: hypothetical protein JXB47_19235 [Anaerolineae bacterium]|nr:hypothetical protein [Anaerolineae bacterium]